MRAGDKLVVVVVIVMIRVVDSVDSGEFKVRGGPGLFW